MSTLANPHLECQTTEAREKNRMEKVKKKKKNTERKKKQGTDFPFSTSVCEIRSFNLHQEERREMNRRKVQRFYRFYEMVISVKYCIWTYED